MFYIKNPYILENAQLWLTMEMFLEKKVMLQFGNEDTKTCNQMNKHKQE